MQADLKSSYEWVSTTYTNYGTRNINQANNNSGYFRKLATKLIEFEYSQENGFNGTWKCEGNFI
jgi:hypothetical protein